MCKRAPVHAAEALECLGGNGYVEESQMPRLFRESPLNGIWEGSGNVAALDLMRVMAREPEAVEAFFAEVALAQDRRVADAAERVLKRLAAAGEADARRVAEEMTLVLQASLLVRHAPAAVADAFCASRLAGDWGRALGTLPPASTWRRSWSAPPRREPATGHAAGPARHAAALRSLWIGSAY